MLQTDRSFDPAFSLVGSYKLVASTRTILDTGEVSDTFGKQPSGYINYAPDGRVMVLIVWDKNDRPAPESGVAPTDEESASLFRTMVAYGGTMSLTVTPLSIMSTFRGMRDGPARRKFATCRRTATSSSTPPHRLPPHLTAR